MTTLIHFIRHGTPVGGNRYRGNRIDDPLSEKGWQQMQSAIEHLPLPDKVISSPMTRCLAFAEDYCSKHQLDAPLIDSRIREIGFGAWEGHSSGEILEKDPDAIRRFYHDPVNERPEGAEDLAGFRARVDASLQDIRRQYTGQRTLVVTHAGVMRAVTGIVLDTPLASLYRVWIGNAAILTLKDDGTRPLTLQLE